MSSLVIKMEDSTRIPKPKSGYVAVFVDETDKKLKAKQADNTVVELNGEFVPSSPIYIPKLETRILTVTKEGDSVSHDKLYVKWESPSYEFLDLNPEIWIFKPTVHTGKFQKMIDSSLVWHRFREKKLGHPTHGDGTKHLGENQYSGKHAIMPLHGGGQFQLQRNTEFNLPSYNDGWSLLNLDPFQWFIKKYEDNPPHDFDSLSQEDIDGLDGGEDYVVYCPGDKHQRLKFSLAIVIDNPLESGKKIVGPQSRLLTLKFIYNLKRFIYTSNKRN